MKNLFKGIWFVFALILLVVFSSTAMAAVELTGVPTEVNMGADSTTSYTLTFRNTGTSESNVRIFNDGTNPTLTYSINEFVLGSGTFRTVTMTINTNSNTGNYGKSVYYFWTEQSDFCFPIALEQGGEICKNKTFTKQTAENFNIVVSEPDSSKLVIADLDIDATEDNHDNLNDGDSLEEIRPGDILGIDMEIENLFDENEEDLTIENIEVIFILKDVDDGDDIELEFDDFDLDAEESATLTGEIEIPYEVDEGTYDLYIDIEGEDEDGINHEIHWKLEVVVEKEKEALIITETDLMRDTLSCDRYNTLDVTIMNIGQKNLDDITVEIESSALGISETWELDELEAGSWDDDISDSETISFTIDDDVAAGTYSITIKAYYDNGDELGDTEAVTLTVEKCGGTSTDDNDDETSNDDSENDYEPVIIINSGTDDTYKAVSSSTKSTWPITQEPWFMPVLITLVILIAIAVIVEIVILL